MESTNDVALKSPMEFGRPGQSTASLSTHANSVTHTPNVLIGLVIAVCVLPFLLNLLGFDFGSRSQSAEESADHLGHIDAQFHRLSGAFTHTILEWTAFCAAIFTVILAFSHYRITGNITTPIIGVALFCAGCMDAFHTLAADRLIEAVADNRNLIPFTWAISRVFNALILIAGVGIFFITGAQKLRTEPWFIVLISLGFGAIAYGIIHYCATSVQLPQTMYPDSLITRPWDVAPLILFVVAGFVIFPQFYKRNPSLFAHALIISAIPEVAVELHMAFGSTALFDNHFNIAHFLKIFAYLVPFGGLVLDYVQTYKEEQVAYQKLSEAQSTLGTYSKELEQMNTDLKRSNADLEQFAYVASHDLQEPLRMVASYTQLLAKRYQGRLDKDADEFIGFAVDGAKRMQVLVSGLLAFSRVGPRGQHFQQSNGEQIIDTALTNLQITTKESGAVISRDPMPAIVVDITQFAQLFQNLISNAIKYRGEGPLQIHIGVQSRDGEWLFSVRDNGIGIDPQFHERIFIIFQRLHGTDKYSGTGIGLALCKKIVEGHGGRIWVDSTPMEGSTFYFTLPKVGRDLARENEPSQGETHYAR